MDNLAAELQEKNEQLQKDMKEFMNRFNNGKYDYILSYSEALPNVLFANPKYDITNEVIKALNEEYIQKNKK
jgi:Skp family chaperone for outer membrane proteins